MAGLKGIIKEPQGKTAILNEDPLTADETPSGVGESREAGLSDEEIYKAAIKRQRDEEDALRLKQNPETPIADSELKGTVPGVLVDPLYQNLSRAQGITHAVRDDLLDAKLSRNQHRQSTVIDEDEVNLDGVSNDDANAVIYRVEAASAEIAAIREEMIKFFLNTPVTNKDYQEGAAAIQKRMEHVIKALGNLSDEVREDMPNAGRVAERLLNAKMHMETASEKLDDLSKLTAESLMTRAEKLQTKEIDGEAPAPVKVSPDMAVA